SSGSSSGSSAGAEGWSRLLMDAGKGPEGPPKKQKTDNPVLVYFEKLLFTQITQYKCEYKHGEGVTELFGECIDLQLPGVLDGVTTLPRLIVRDCFSEVAEILIKAGRAQLWGGSGIGKTAFLAYLVTQLSQNTPGLYTWRIFFRSETN